jgi:hypothetical protein
MVFNASLVSFTGGGYTGEPAEPLAFLPYISQWLTLQHMVVSSTP